MSTFKNDIHPFKGHNANLVLSVLMTMKTATRKQLAQRTGLSQPTVNSIVQDLENNGVVQPGNFAASAGGRRPQCYTIKTDHLRAATIRILSHSLEYMVVTVDGTIILRNSWATEDEGIMTSLQTLLATLLKQDESIRVVSIGVPGVVGPGGVLYAIPQTPELEGIALVHELNKSISIPIYVENDMNLVALGSVAAESGQTEATDMVFVHIGEGVGAGIVMGGQIIQGFSSFAGEIAFIPYPTADVKNAENRGQETLEYLLAQTTDIAKRAKLISSMIISIICLLNPPVLSFGSEYASEEMLKHLRYECEKHLPHWTLPTFKLMLDEETSYERGLMALVNDFLKNHITHELTPL